MEIVDFVPVCGSLKKHGRKGTYHILKNDTEVSDCHHNVATLSPSVKVVEVIPKIQPKSTNLLKRFRDAYVEGMLTFALHVAHMNNGDICHQKNIHDDDDVLVLMDK